MFKIQVADADITGGSVAITWCLDQELIHNLAVEQNLNPQILFVISPVDDYRPHKEQRILAPLKDLMAYIPFYYKTNKVNIRALIVMDYYSDKYIENTFLSRYGYEYRLSLLNNDGSDWSLTSDMIRDLREYNYFTVEQATNLLTLDIPSEYFAKEPPQWEQAWVNHFFLSPSKDQCAYKQRRIFAYTLQIPIMAINIIIRLLYCLYAFLLLARSFSLKYLLHPLTYTLGSLPWNPEGSYAIRKVSDSDDGWKHFIKKYWSLPFMPAILLIIFLMAKIPALAIVIGALITICALAILSVIIFSFFQGFNEITEYCFGKASAWYANKASAWYSNKDEIDVLSCDTDQKNRDALLRQKKTIKLYMADLKSKNCRPYAR